METCILGLAIKQTFISKDPKRTRAAKRRKLLSIKKRRAYYDRQKKHQEKELRKFQSTQSINTSQKPTHPSFRQCRRLERKTFQSWEKMEMKFDLNANQHKLISYCITYLEMKMVLEAQNKERIASMESRNYENEDHYQSKIKEYLAGKDRSNQVEKNSVQNHNGLRGGAPRTDLDLRMNDNLQLTNTRNDCFVNSVIQLLSVTDYASFLRTQFLNIVVGTHPQSYRVSRELAKLFNAQTHGTKSAATLRRYVAQLSGKSFFDLGTQEDAGEFLSALEETLCNELITFEDFKNVRSKHWGTEEVRRLFRDNTQHGKCQICGLYPSIKSEPFLMLQLNIPNSKQAVSLSAIIQNHYLENSDSDKMRCPNCCPHDRKGQKCSQKGICRPKEAAELVQLKTSPKFLFIQLLRYDSNETKVMTHVKVEVEVKLPGTDTYELCGAIDHIGTTRNSGHYVTHTRQESGYWMYFDDTFNKASSFKEANTANNYLLLLKKKSPGLEADTPFHQHEEITASEGTVKKKISCVFVNDNEAVGIQDKKERDNNNLTDKLNLQEDPYNLDNDWSMRQNILEKECRGCGKVMERLLRHLNSKKGRECMERYTEEEILLHKSLQNTNKYKTYRNNNK